MDLSKICAKCNQEKALSLFNYQSDTKSKTSSYCSECQKNYAKENYIKNREAKKAIALKRYHETKNLK